MRIPFAGWVAPFGDPGITDRSHLPRAFRSVPRPSSPLSAKASTRCPYLRLIPGLAARRDRKTPPRTGAKPHAIWRPHMKTLLRIRAHGYAARPIRLGHMTNSLFTLQTTPPPGLPRTVSLGLLQTPDGGGERTRTDDLLLAKQALSQLSYTPRSRTWQ